MTKTSINIRRISLALCLGWSFLISFTMFYQMKNIREDTVTNGLIQARIAFSKDLVYRRWNASQGGIYVEVTEQTPANPYLEVEDRDIASLSGRSLTLINPAYMTRMVHELEQGKKGLRGHLTSLNPLNPNNAPDLWERRSLQTFSKAEDLAFSVEEMDGDSYLRYMRPFIVVQSCLKCHGHQDYALGDLRGGISISVPMAPLLALQSKAIQNSFFLHFSLWVSGLLGLGWGSWRMNCQLKKQQQAETELIKSKLTLDQIHDCVFIFSPETLQFSYVNDGAVTQVGYSKEKLLSMTPLDIKPDFTEKSFREFISPLLKEPGRSLSFETSHWHKDGFIVPVEIKLQYLNLADNEGRFVAVARDLSQRNKDKEEYQRLFDASQDAIMVLTQEGFVDCNRAALEVFGFTSKKEFLQLQPADVSPERQPDGTLSKQAAQQHTTDAMENRAAFFTWQHCRKDGTEFPAEVLLSPFERNGVQVIQAVVRDLSERLRAEKEKEKLQAKLLHAQKLESVGQLAAGIAHEINTPTQFIGTNLDFMEEAVEDISGFMTTIKTIAAQASPEIRLAIEKAVEEADWDYLTDELPKAVSQSKEGVQRVSSIVRAMKEFSHPGSKEAIATDLNRLIETTITVARNEWKYVAEMEMNLDPSLPPVFCLSDEMGQVILNILVNGAHAIAERLGDTPDAGLGHLTVSSSYDEQQVQVRISDSGGGIPPEVQERIFDPFFTTKNVGKGTGQGLAIAHDVVTEKHDGTLTFESEADKGTTFIITLPLPADHGTGDKI